MVPDIIVAGGVTAEGDERLWVPQSDTVSFRPLVLNVTQGYYVNVLRVRRSGVLSRHRHFGPVHAFVMKGSWRYLEHDWVAREGDYVFEPPGETHTLVVHERGDRDDDALPRHRRLRLLRSVWRDDGGGGRLHQARCRPRHFAAVGLGEDYASASCADRGGSPRMDAFVCTTCGTRTGLLLRRDPRRVAGNGDPFRRRTGRGNLHRAPHSPLGRDEI